MRPTALAPEQPSDRERSITGHHLPGRRTMTRVTQVLFSDVAHPRPRRRKGPYTRAHAGPGILADARDRLRRLATPAGLDMVTPTPMALTKDDVRHVARLANLVLTEEEEARMAGELSQILEYVARLEGLDTTGVAPLAHVHDVACPEREDAVRPSLPAEKAVENAPETDGAAFSVPRIIEEAS
jgi:aspartyl-tRNA(Asn)/glutamyl-tRNA(Gln) amidotransferase subunit C